MRLVIHYSHPDPNVPDGTIVNEGYTLTVGRANPANGNLVDVNLYWDKSVSRRHALLYYDNGNWWVRDLDSTHGTRFANSPITNPIKIESGGTLKLGDTTLRLEYRATAILSTDSQEGLLGEQITLDPIRNPLAISETARISILARIAGISKLQREDSALNALIHEIRAIFGEKADHVGILLYQDKEPLPVAFHPPEKAYFSSALVRRAVQDMTAFVWERSTLSGDSELVASLKDVTTAMYVPNLYNRQPKGILHVDSTSAQTRFTKDELVLLSEIASSAALRLLDRVKISDEVSTVFISYSRGDLTFVRQLAGDLRKHVVSVWFDERLRSGQDWREQVQRVIETVDVCILVMSPNSLVSPNVAWELDYLRQLKKPLLPALIKESPIPDNLAWLRNIHYINMMLDYKQSLANLIDDIHSLHPKTSS